MALRQLFGSKKKDEPAMQQQSSMFTAPPAEKSAGIQSQPGQK
jgi:hypothetical protein